MRKGKILTVLVILILGGACTPNKIMVDKQVLNKYLENSAVFKNSHTGFSLFDPEKNAFLFNYNANKFFTPASNTKLFTFYAGKEILGDSIESIKVCELNDTLYFTGLADPTFLHPEFKNQLVFNHLKAQGQPITYIEQPLYNARFGPGWSWDDYPFYFQPERSSMPVYGNVVTIDRLQKDTLFHIEPAYFKAAFEIVDDTTLQENNMVFSREEYLNRFKLKYHTLPDTVERQIPFLYSKELLISLLSDTLSDVTIGNKFPAGCTFTLLKSQPVDSLMKIMLVESDNFLAEQIILMCALKIADSLDSQITIKYAFNHLFDDIANQLHWVDGSGLSRYNQFTPLAFIQLINKLYHEYPKSYLYEMLPKGGVNGTLKNNFLSDYPYILAKTGSMSNVYNLSGFLVTRSGKWLIFSFMNNNFMVPSYELKAEMENILLQIHDKY